MGMGDQREIEDAPWEASLASLYREALRDAPSPVLARCIDRLESGAIEEELVIVEDVPPPKGMLLRRHWLASGFDAALVCAATVWASPSGGPGWAGWIFGGIVAFAYLTLCAFLGGRTLGDRLTGLRLIAPTGGRLGLAKAALRSLLAILGIVSVVGLFWTLVDASGQSLHDRILGLRTGLADQP